MDKLVIYDTYGMTEVKGVPVASSRKVSEYFDKRHDNVLRDIEELLKGLLTSEESSRFVDVRFIKSTYKNLQGKRQPEYLMTKDAFTLLAMGFKGKKALKFKLDYITGFNQMEIFIHDSIDLKKEFPEFTDAISSAHENPQPFHYSNELDMINLIVAGMKAKQFKEFHGLGDVKSIRPYLNFEQIDHIKKLVRADIGLLWTTKEYEERKRLLTNCYNKNKLKQIGA